MTSWWGPLLEPSGLLLRDRVLAVADPDDLLIALRAGRLRRLQRCVYLPREVELTPLLAARSALLSCGVALTVASHHTAARILGLELPPERRREHVTVPRELRRRDRRDLRFHGRPLRLGEVVTTDGVPFTGVGRTLVDLATQLPRLRAVWAMDDALRRGLCTWSELADAAERFGGWRRGEVLARVRACDGVSESVLETAARLTMLDAGHPMPVAQHVVCDEHGDVVARLDHAYPEDQLGLEYDGIATHGRAEALIGDRRRDNRLSALGWTILRFTWWDIVEDPERFLIVVRAGLARRRA